MLKEVAELFGLPNSAAGLEGHIDFAPPSQQPPSPPPLTAEEIKAADIAAALAFPMPAEYDITDHWGGGVAYSIWNPLPEYQPPPDD
jgi:hypothetical protein